jgi:hypothetical protein
VTRGIALVLVLLVLACGAGPMQAKRRPPELLNFIIVPAPPPVVPVEIQPPKPVDDATWIHGQWAWRGDRWRWRRGGWAVLPEGATVSTWVYAYQADGRLRFWPATWLDAGGQPIPEPKMLARAKRRFDRR